MLDHARPVTFVATADPPRALSFYGETLGLPLVEDTPFALVFDNHGVRLRIQKGAPVARAPYTVLGWEVPDIDATVRGLRARGVAFNAYTWLEQDALGIWTAPGGARIAWFTDPDGNVLSLSQGA